MKESKNNYPNFYLAPLQAVSSLIEISSAFLKENKKITEVVFNTGSKKQTKVMTIRNDKTKSPTKLNARTIAGKKIITKKNLAKNRGKKVNPPAIDKKSSLVKKKAVTPTINKAKSMVKKKAVIPKANKAKNSVKKKIVSPAAKKAKSSVKKKIVSSAKSLTKSVAKKKVTTPLKRKTKSSIKEIKKNEIPKIETHGEDMHFIHEKGENHQRTRLENHQAENIFHHQADVALHQENRKVMDARPSNKIFKRYNRSKGQR